MRVTRRAYKLYLFTVLTLTLTTQAFSQTATLIGTVTDSETGEPLPGANVVVQSATVQTGGATDVVGDYEVGNLAAGTYTVIVSYIGYERQTMSNVVFNAGETRILDFFLNSTGIEVNPISVTASRRPEKVLEAPASVSVLDVEQIEGRPVLTASEHLKATPAVDIVQTGMSQSNVVVRGFNNIFSGALLSLVDNRISRVPSLRLNAYNFIPTTNEDIERFEVVLGPGSALYGPNAANGVFHMLTKSPIGSEGTTVSVAGGERDLFMTSFRHAGSVNQKFGYKISAQYYQATDWKFRDPAEPAQIRRFRPTAQGPVFIDPAPIDNSRDFDIEKIAAEARFDFRPTEETSAIFTAGFNQATNLELTGIGAGQAIDWTYGFVQARFRHKQLFAQGFINFSDAGDTYTLRSGQLIVDNSKLFVGQLQHSTQLSDRQLFTYGVDGLFTRPQTDNTINGRNEDNDNINEVGVYLQSETDLTPKLRFVGAARIDDHSELEDPVFSPRAALVFRPTPTDNFRVTFNRAFSTPTALNLSLDILQAPDPFGLGAFQVPLGLSTPTNIDIRAQGVPSTGFNFSRGSGGGFQFRSPFAPLDPRSLSPSSFIDLNDPIFTNVMWGVGSGAVSSAFVPQYVAGLIDAGVPPANAQALGQQFLTIVPAQVAGVNNILMTLDPQLAAAGAANPFFPDTPFDVPRIKEETTQTFEFGYKGILGEKLVVGVDAYYTEIKDFISPLLVVTPNVFLDPTTLAATVGQQFGAALAAPQNAELDTTLVQALDPTARGGNGNGSAVDELTALYVGGAVRIPYGTVSPQEAFDPTAVIVTYRNFGEVDFWGMDLNFNYFFNNRWSLGGNYSYVSEDLFQNLDGIDDIALNAPQHKFGANINYRNRESGLDANLRLRFTDSFPVKTATYVGMSDRYAVLDLVANYELPFSRNTNLNLTIQNLTDNKHREIVGAPEIGRLAIVRLTQSF